MPPYLGSSKVHNSAACPGTTLILYVDDDPVNQHVLQSCLADQQQMTVELTAGADDTLEYLECVDYLPDLVLMDNQLVGTTGVKVWTYLKPSVCCLRRICWTLWSAEGTPDLRVLFAWQ